MSGQSKQAPIATDEASLIALIERHLKKVMGSEFDTVGFTADRSFEEMGLDSLFMAEVNLVVSSEVDVYLPMSELAGALTPRKLAHAVQRTLTGAV